MLCFPFKPLSYDTLLVKILVEERCIMKKDAFVVRIPKDLDEEFRKEVKRQGKQFNLSLEEAMKLWIADYQKRINDN